MKVFEIFWSDLSIEKQKELVEQGFDVHDNIDLIPIAIIDQDPDENIGF